MRPAVFALLFVGSGLLFTPALAAQRFNLPDGQGRDLVYGHCQTCHDLQSIEDSSGIRRGAWNAVLDNMKGFGLRITDDQRARILDYLAMYLGPKPPPATAPAETPAATQTADGAEVFNNTCVACHQTDGKGKAGEFPPLAGNADLFLAPDFVPAVALNGLAGPIDINGQKLDKEMPAFDFLSDGEIAAVVNYVRSNWGNNAIKPSSFPDLMADEVATIRAKPKTPAEVHAYRASLRR